MSLLVLGARKLASAHLLILVRTLLWL